MKSPFPHSISCVCILIAAQCALFAQGRAARPGNPAEIHGQVRLAQDDAPANSVLVKIESYGGSGRAEQVVTDRTGKFSFPGLSPAQYLVTAHAAGFKDTQQIVDLQAASSDYIIFRLTEDRSTPTRKETGSAAVVNANVPPEAQKEFDAGRAALVDDDAAGSILHFEKAVEIYPVFLEAQLALGTALMDVQKWSEAERALRQALEIDPKTANALFALGEIYFRQSKNAEAETAFQQGLVLAPRSARAHLTLAQVYWQIASANKNQKEVSLNLENSYREVKQAVDLDPQLADAHVLKGNLLLRAQRGNEALAEFEEYLRLDPKGPRAATVRGLIKRIRAALQSSDSTH
jgi:tetratricopeptide (TPR) repeat protein